MSIKANDLRILTVSYTHLDVYKRQKQTENEDLEPNNLQMNENRMEVEELVAENK